MGSLGCLSVMASDLDNDSAPQLVQVIQPTDDRHLLQERPAGMIWQAQQHALVVHDADPHRFADVVALPNRWPSCCFCCCAQVLSPELCSLVSNPATPKTLSATCFEITAELVGSLAALSGTFQRQVRRG